MATSWLENNMFGPSDGFLHQLRNKLGRSLNLLLPGRPGGPDPSYPRGRVEAGPSKAPVSTKEVYMVASPLSFTAPQRIFARYPGGAYLFTMLTGINTMHWGLRIGDDLYVDLKRVSGGKISFEFANKSTRDENEGLRQVYLGVTHFDDTEAMTLLARHRVSDHDFKDYFLVYYNCQTFAMNMLATDILCPVCQGPSNAYYSYLTLALVVRRFAHLLLAVPAYVYYWFIMAPWIWLGTKLVRWHLLLSPLPPILIIASMRGLFQMNRLSNGSKDLRGVPTSLAMLRVGINPCLREYPSGGYLGPCSTCSREDLSMLRQLGACSLRNPNSPDRTSKIHLSLWLTALTFPIWCGGELQAVFVIGLLGSGRVYAGLYLVWLTLTYWLILQNPDRDFARIGLVIKVIFYRGARDAYAILLLYSIRVGTYLTNPHRPAAYHLMYDLIGRIWNVQTWPAQVAEAVKCACYDDCRSWQVWVDKVPEVASAVARRLPTWLINALAKASGLVSDVGAGAGAMACDAARSPVNYYEQRYPTWMRNHRHWESDWFWYWVMYVDGSIVLLYVSLTIWVLWRELTATDNESLGTRTRPSTKRDKKH